MDILDNYLNTMFSRYPLTPQTQEAKRELRAMMEDAYNGALAAGHSQNEAVGQVLAEFGNLEEVAPLLGLSATAAPWPAGESQQAASQDMPNEKPDMLASGEDQLVGGQDHPTGDRYHPAWRASSSETTTPPETGTWTAPASAPKKYEVTMPQAQNYADTMKQTRWMLALGVALIIVGAAPFIGLGAAYGDAGGTRETTSLVIGFAVMLPLVCAGVGQLIYRGQKLSPFRRITSRTDVCPPEVIAYANALRERNAAAYTRSLIIAVVVWIISAFPLLAAGILTENWEQEKADPIIGLGLATTAVLVALGLLIFLPHTWASSVAAKVNGESAGPMSADVSDPDVDRYPTWVRAIFAGFWPLITAIYLAWSFITEDWGITWIIWPVVAVLFSAFAAVIGSIYPEKKNGSHY